MAVGSYYSTTTSQTVPLAELWDGSAWTIQSVPLPSGAESGALTGVSCPAEATCSSVGAYSTPGTGQMPLAEAWDGTNWTIQSTAIPAGSSSSALHAVWCESAKSCSAVGINASSSGGSLTLAESWDGTSWTIEPTPNPNASSYNGFTNLSCAPEGKPCTAVGFSGNTTLTESWDGMTWGELPITPEPAGSTQSSFSDVSCTAPNVCTAVGQYLDSTEGPTGAYLTLAERWNGTSWTIQPTANPALAGTDAATNITSSTADLHGTVYPGGAATTCYFEYGTTSAYGSTIPCAQTTGPGAAPVSVSANLASLSPNTTYNFNLVATNAGGGMTYTPSPASSFTTLATSGGSPGGGTGSSGTGGGSSTGATPPGGSSGGGGGTSPCVSGPGNPPRAVVILLTGIDSQLPYSESYNPLTQSYCGLYSTLNPSLADLSEMAIQAFDSSGDGQIQPVNLTDALAESGALLLPFSYNGSTLSGSSTNPTYSVQSFGENVPGERLPDVEADTYLLQLVNQVHGLWKNTPIFVIGHSNGGLIAEQLFERHSVNELAGVARIVSLDSPINGLGIPLGVSTQLSDFYHNRWQSRAALQTQMIGKEKQSGQLFLPIGTEGDTLYQWSDLACPGIESQVIWVVRPCSNGGGNGMSIFSRITPEPATFGSPSWPSQGGSGLTGLLGFDSHKFVMQSPDNIAFLDQLVRGNAAHASATASSVHEQRGSFTASTASAAVGYEQMNYAPRIRARLTHEIAAEGGTITVLGSGLGTSPGTVKILGNTSMVELPVEQWTPVQITVGVPAHAATGLVSVTTPTAGTAIAGLVAVTASQRTQVARLARVRSPRVFEGEPQTIEIRAKDIRGHVVRGATVQVVSAGEIFNTVTSSNGIVSVRVPGWGCEPLLATSGTVSVKFIACWQRLMSQHMTLRLHEKHGKTTVSALIKTRIPVRGEYVHFQLVAGSCARLLRPHDRTNSHGLANVEIVNRCGTSVVVEAVTDHKTVASGILVTP